jgi:hypothetical protein
LDSNRWLGIQSKVITEARNHCSLEDFNSNNMDKSQESKVSTELLDNSLSTKLEDFSSNSHWELSKVMARALNRDMGNKDIVRWEVFSSSSHWEPSKDMDRVRLGMASKDTDNKELGTDTDSKDKELGMVRIQCMPKLAEELEKNTLKIRLHLPPVMTKKLEECLLRIEKEDAWQDEKRSQDWILLREEDSVCKDEKTGERRLVSSPE